MEEYLNIAKDSNLKKKLKMLYNWINTRNDLWTISNLVSNLSYFFFKFSLFWMEEATNSLNITKDTIQHETIDLK